MKLKKMVAIAAGLLMVGVLGDVWGEEYNVYVSAPTKSDDTKILESEIYADPYQITVKKIYFTKEEVTEKHSNYLGKSRPLGRINFLADNYDINETDLSKAIIASVFTNKIYSDNTSKKLPELQSLDKPSQNFINENIDKIVKFVFVLNKKNITVIVNPLDNDNYDVFFSMDADLKKDKVIFAEPGIPEGAIEAIQEAALFEPSETDNCYYSYFSSQDPITQETFTYRPSYDMVSYLINSKNISKLTESADGNYTIPNIANIPITKVDENDDKSKILYENSPLKNKGVFVDGKVVNWLRIEKNMNMIRKSAIGKFKEEKKQAEEIEALKKLNEEADKSTSSSTTGSGKALEIAGQADLNNLANTLYKLALPTH